MLPTVVSDDEIYAPAQAVAVGVTPGPIYFGNFSARADGERRGLGRVGG